MRPLVTREVGFYQQLARWSGIHIPRCYYAILDGESGEGMLLLEDLGHCTFHRDTAGCSRTEALAALTELARFHANWWGHPRLAELDWLPVHIADLNENARFYCRLWPTFVQQFGEHVPELLITFGSILCEEAERRFPALFSEITAHPPTLQHGDFRLDNLAFHHAEEQLQVIAYDWQTLRRGRGAFDLARFIITSLDVENRRDWELELLEAYHASLVREGVRDYAFEQCQRESLIGAIQNSIQQVIAGVVLKMTDPVGLTWHKVIGVRLAALIEDHRLQQLLVQASGPAPGVTHHRDG